MNQQPVNRRPLNLARLFLEKKCRMRDASLLGRPDLAEASIGELAPLQFRLAPLTLQPRKLSGAREMQERFMNAGATVFLRDVTARVAHRILYFINCVGRAGRHRGDFAVQH